MLPLIQHFLHGGHGAPGGTLCPISPSDVPPHPGEPASIPLVLDDDVLVGEGGVVELVELSPQALGAIQMMAIAISRRSNRHDRVLNSIIEPCPAYHHEETPGAWSPRYHANSRSTTTRASSVRNARNDI